MKTLRSSCPSAGRVSSVSRQAANFAAFFIVSLRLLLGAGIFAEIVEQKGIYVERKPRVRLAIGPGGAVEAPRGHEDHIARIGGVEAGLLDQIFALAFQDEPEFLMVDMEVAFV